jgi:hypothetical protein
MAAQIDKELLLAEDCDFGFGATDQERGGNRFNASHLPYTSTISVEVALNDRYLKSESDIRYAYKAGDALQVFSVLAGLAGNEAVNFTQLDLKANQSAVDLKADIANVLELGNNDPYIPTTDYQPATKRFVDESIVNAFFFGVSGSFTSADDKTITVTNGLITGIL